MPDDVRLDMDDADRDSAARTGLRAAMTLPLWFMVMVATAIGLAVLAQAGDFLVPLVIAVLIFSLTSAAIDWMAGRRIGPLVTPYWLATVAGVLVVAAVVLALTFVVSAQIDALVVAGPLYIDRTQAVLAELLARVDDEMAEGVEAAFADLNPAAYLRVLAGSAGSLLVTTMIVFIYAGFLLAERGHFVRKLTLMCPDAADARAVESIIDSIARSVHRYVLVKTDRKSVV